MFYSSPGLPEWPKQRQSSHSCSSLWLQYSDERKGCRTKHSVGQSQLQIWFHFNVILTYAQSCNLCHSAVIFCSAVPTLFTCMYIVQCTPTYLLRYYMGIPLFIFNIRLKTKTSCQSTKQIINQQKYVSKKIVFRDLVISQNTVQCKDGQDNFLHLLVIIKCFDKSRIWLFWILSWKTTRSRITVQVSKMCFSRHLNL